MSLITYNGLVKLVERGVIEGVPHENINAASIDVTLGPRIWYEDEYRPRIVDLAAKQTPPMIAEDVSVAPFVLHPGAFVLAQTCEIFNLPDDIACEFRLKSSGARAGLDQALAVWCDPGWHGSVLTMELRNNLQHNALLLSVGMKCGQIVFWRGEHVPKDRSYRTRGQYNNDTTATQSKGIR